MGTLLAPRVLEYVFRRDVEVVHKEGHTGTRNVATEYQFDEGRKGCGGGLYIHSLLLDQSLQVTGFGVTH